MNKIQTPENQTRNPKATKAAYETPVLIAHGNVERVTLQTGTA